MNETVARKIRVLDEHIANQIAAGEVVERPSSIVKELVENAIDAHSSNIQIAIEEGGLQSIKVTDNGTGIASEDCLTAFERHATSKIEQSRHLFQIKSLGFRGEALPSIAAVSKLECITSTRSDGLGHKVAIEGGELTVSEETAASRGTSIKVSDLFYNTPARLKYMKSIQTELSHISNYVYRLSLAHPHIAFTFSHNGKVLLQTLGNGELLQTIAAIYGATVARQMVPVQGESIDYELQGYIGKPETTRANRFGISLIVNGRYIQNFALAKAVMNAYHTLLPINRFPIAVLTITMDPSLLDVNVHPSKLEVRFSKEQELLQFIEATVRKQLQEQVLIPKGRSASEPKRAVVQEQLQWERPASVRPASVRQSQSAQSRVASESNEQDETEQRGRSNSDVEHKAPIRTDVPSRTAYRSGISRSGVSKDSTSRKMTPSGNRPHEMKEVLQAYETVEHKERVFPTLYPIGQMRGTYIIAQNEEGLYLIDQHAAHERIQYEYFYEKFSQPASVSQQLLVPITLEFTPSEAAILKERLPLFEQAGVYIEYFGGNSFIVRSYPEWFPKGDEKMIIEEMAEWIVAEGKSVDIAALREESAIMCSCKAAIKANDHLSDVEIEALLEQLAECRNPYTCPHGRPIMISYSNYELEKMFKRV